MIQTENYVEEILTMRIILKVSHDTNVCREHVAKTASNDPHGRAKKEQDKLRMGRKKGESGGVSNRLTFSNRLTPILSHFATVLTTHRPGG